MDSEEISMWLAKPEVQEKLAPIKRLQGVLLELLLVIDKVCSENGLSYCLFYGTLLGALRHRGFIPWDDDADIIMPRGDYEKLLHLPATSWPNGYFLQSPYSDKYSRFAFAKLRKNGTVCTCDDHAHIKMHQGIFVDIFPLDQATGRSVKYLWRIPRVFERLAALSCVRLPNRYKWLSVVHKMWKSCFSPSFFSRIGNFIAINLNIVARSFLAVLRSRCYFLPKRLPLKVLSFVFLRNQKSYYLNYMEIGNLYQMKISVAQYTPKVG